MNQIAPLLNVQVESFSFFYFSFLQPPVRYWQESPKEPTNENTAEKDEAKNDPKQTLPKQQRTRVKKRTQKAEKRQQDEEQPDGKTFLSGVTMT